MKDAKRLESLRRRTMLRALLGLASMPKAPLADAALAAASAPPDLATCLARGEAALQRGEAELAVQAFEQAGALGHNPAVELGLVRAAMQAGRYGQALGFAAHTAGEHPRDAACVAAYLWLLKLGGQDGFAAQLGSSSSGPFPWPEADRALLQAVHAAWAGDWPQASGELRKAPLRLAPHAHGHPLPPQARTVATGTLVCDAQGVQRAVVPHQVLRAGTGSAWWLRNGLGLTVRAQCPADAVTTEGPLVALRPDTPLPGTALLPAPRDPFPGSPAFAFAYGLDVDGSEAPATDSEASRALAAWPLMKMGFAGAMVPARLERWLGIEARAGANPLGGPVLDAHGRLTGVSLGCAQDASPERLVPVSFLIRQGWCAVPAPVPGPGERLAAEALYERGMGSALQVIRA